MVALQVQGFCWIFAIFRVSIIRNRSIIPRTGKVKNANRAPFLIWNIPELKRNSIGTLFILVLPSHMGILVWHHEHETNIRSVYELGAGIHQETLETGPMANQINWKGILLRLRIAKILRCKSNAPLGALSALCPSRGTVCSQLGWKVRLEKFTPAGKRPAGAVSHWIRARS